MKADLWMSLFLLHSSDFENIAYAWFSLPVPQATLLSNIANGVLMSQTKTCPKYGGVMKLKDEIQKDDAASEVTPLDRTYTLIVDIWK